VSAECSSSVINPYFLTALLFCSATKDTKKKAIDSKTCATSNREKYQRLLELQAGALGDLKQNLKNLKASLQQLKQCSLPRAVDSQVSSDNTARANQASDQLAIARDHIESFSASEVSLRGSRIDVKSDDDDGSANDDGRANSAPKSLNPMAPPWKPKKDGKGNLSTAMGL
jgi:hypothetical protein